MTSTNIRKTRLKPASAGLIRLRVLHSEQISPHFTRVTLGGGDIEQFQPMGFDQWFRFFIPVADHGLDRLPTKLDTLAYVKYLAIPKKVRPLLRNFTVRGYRASGPNGPELDLDIITHGSAADGSASAATYWATTCVRGDEVALMDEGVTFTPPEDVRSYRIVADESGLPAIAGILGSIQDDARGQALIEIPDAADRQDLVAPAGMEVIWITRSDPTATPGVAALSAAQALSLPSEPFYGWVVGEQALATGLRRHWVEAGVPKDNITFVGYWKAGKER